MPLLVCFCLTGCVGAQRAGPHTGFKLGSRRWGMRGNVMLVVDSVRQGWIRVVVGWLWAAKTALLQWQQRKPAGKIQGLGTEAAACEGGAWGAWSRAAMGRAAGQAGWGGTESSGKMRGLEKQKLALASSCLKNKSSK